MEIDFASKTFVVIGKLKSMTKDEAWMRISQAGGWTSKTPRPSSDYIIVGNKPTDAKLKRAKEVGKPLLTEEQFLAALKAVEEEREDAREEVELVDVLPDLRGLLAEPHSDTTWGRLTELLDKCDLSQLDAAVDYAEQHIQTWESPAVGAHAPYCSLHPDVPHDVRTAPYQWLTEILKGESSPKFRLIHRIDLGGRNTNGTVAARVLDHPDLTQLQELHLGPGNKLSIKFHKQLLQAPNMAQVHTLSFRNMNEKIAAALCGDHKLQALRYVHLLGPEIYTEQEEYEAMYAALLEADWWSQIEGICCGISHGNKTFWQAHMYGPLVKAFEEEKLPALKHLALTDAYGLERLDGAAILDQIERLSLGECDRKLGVQFLKRLLATPPQSIQTIDIAGCVFHASYYGTSRHKNTDTHALWLSEITKAKDLGSLKEVVICRDQMSKSAFTKAQQWAKSNDITLHIAPWSQGET